MNLLLLVGYIQEKIIFYNQAHLLLIIQAIKLLKQFQAREGKIEQLSTLLTTLGEAPPTLYYLLTITKGYMERTINSDVSPTVDNEKSRIIQHFMAQVKTEDFLNIGFMRPLELALRTNKHDRSVPSDSLPQGLMIADKATINDNKYQLKNIPLIDHKLNHLEELRMQNMDNYISLLKKSPEDHGDALRQSQMKIEQESEVVVEPRHTGMEVGICVSMKSENKKALKSTLVGVANNIDDMIRAGVSPDDIFVVVIIDGVLSVDKSLYEYFEQFERESQIFLQEDEELTIRKKYEHQIYHSEVQKDQPLNYSKFLFHKEEFSERIDSKFINIRKKYDEILRVKKSISTIKKSNNKDNQNLKMIVNRLADKQKKILKNVQERASRMVINEESIMKELSNSEEQCNQYVNTRQDLAYVAPYRLPTSSLSDHCKVKYDEERQQPGQEEMESQLDSEKLMNSQIDRSSMLSNKDKKGRVSKSILYTNLFVCIKYKQAGKLNSHNWFFNGFCQQLNPRYTFLVDVGIKPYPTSMFRMYRYMKVHPNIGGVTGYLRLIQELIQDDNVAKNVDCCTDLFTLLFDIQRAQQVDNHYQHIINKSFQALFQFIHAVPGFFSGYNMMAVRPPGKKDELLRSYFRSIDEKMLTNKIVPSTFSLGSMIARVFLPRTLWKACYHIDPDSEEQLLANENTYQAQNRILSLGIHRNKRDIAFLPNVHAVVEPIKNVADLMEQSKQEINGGVFSFEKVQDEFETVTRKRYQFMVKFQLFYLSSLKFIVFFSPALLLFMLYYATEIVREQFLQSLLATQSATGLGNILYRTFSNIIIFIYALCLMGIIFYSMHLKAKEKKFEYNAQLISSILGFFTILAVLVFIAHIILGFVDPSKSYIHNEYVDQLTDTFDLSTAETIVDLVLYMIYAAIAIIFLPMICYVIIFRKFRIMWQVIVGTPAFIFYFPTYYCILPIYARCRLDDVYFPNKSSLGAKNAHLRQSWKIVKMIDVAKYFIWNVIMLTALLITYEIVLVKLFGLLGLLAMFNLLGLIKWIPGLIFMIKYKYSLKDQPLQPTEEEVNNNMGSMKLRIYDTLRQFRDDFIFNIRSAFEEAAIEAQTKQIEKQFAEQAAQQKALAIAEAKQQQLLQRNQQPVMGRNHQSIRLNDVMGVRQTKLANKVQTIRESSAVRPSYYPFQEGIAKKQPKNNNIPAVPLEMMLLKNQMGAEISKNPNLKQGEQKLKKYENMRTTLRPIGF